MKSSFRFNRLSVVAALLALFALSTTLTFAGAPLGTAFTYEGRLMDGGAPANGTYDLQFKLFDALTNGAQQGSTVTKDDVPVSAGLFTVQLDFGANVFNGDARYLEIAVRAGSSTGAYTTLSPRQPLTAVPYALFSTKPWVTSGNNISYTQGKVGIGQTVPAYKLDILESGNSGLRVETDTAGGKVASFGANGAFEIDGPYFPGGRLVVKENGNVGIGTSSPTYKLTVVGTAHVLDNLFANKIGVGTTSPMAKLDIVANTVDAGFNTANFSDPAIGPNISHIHYGTTGDWYIRSAANSGKVILQDSAGKVGIGTANPAAKLDVIANTASAGSNTANFSNPTIGPNLSHVHFGTTGDWYIRSAVNSGKVILQDSGGNVGIGTNNPTDKLTVAGTINSTSSGFKFPDGTTQATAIGNTFTAFRSVVVEINHSGQGAGSLIHLDLPPGNYLLEASARFANIANLVGQDNSRTVDCYLASDWYNFELDGSVEGGDLMPISVHAVKIYSQQPTTGVDFSCVAFDGGTDRSYVTVGARRLSAVKVGNITVQP